MPVFPPPHLPGTVKIVHPRERARKEGYLSRTVGQSETVLLPRPLVPWAEGKALSHFGTRMDVAGVYKILATALGWEEWERLGCKTASRSHLTLSLTLSCKSPPQRRGS